MTTPIQRQNLLQPRPPFLLLIGSKHLKLTCVSENGSASNTTSKSSWDSEPWKGEAIQPTLLNRNNWHVFPDDEMTGNFHSWRAHSGLLDDTMKAEKAVKGVLSFLPFSEDFWVVFACSRSPHTVPQFRVPARVLQSLPNETPATLIQKVVEALFWTYLLT